ncbi:MAG: CMP/dCMP deaminase zinc-binding [uncultured bacterium]|nr:MAG: CMP/dCMP deaminase zinc-binding [uncultured bacterium]
MTGKSDNMTDKDKHKANKGNIMTNKGEKFMQEAVKIALSNAGSVTGGPFGAVIVKDGTVISTASNSVTIDNDPTAHAEVNAIRSACAKLKTFNLTGCTLYTSCEPCPMCLSAAYWAHIDKIYYSAGRDDAQKAGFSDAFIYDEFSKQMSERSIPIEQILKNEGVEPFDEWMRNDKKVHY